MFCAIIDFETPRVETEVLEKVVRTATLVTLMVKLPTISFLLLGHSMATVEDTCETPANTATVSIKISILALRLRGLVLPGRGTLHHCMMNQVREKNFLITSLAPEVATEVSSSLPKPIPTVLKEQLVKRIAQNRSNVASNSSSTQKRWGTENQLNSYAI